MIYLHVWKKRISPLILKFYLLNFKKLALLKSNKFVFSNEKLNKILYLLPEKKSNLSLIESLNEYIIDNNINLNSIGYSHMINFYLNTKGFAYGYSIFLQVV